MLDAAELLCDRQALGAVGTNASTNYRVLPTAGTPPLNATAIPFDVSKGTPMEIIAQMVETATSAGAATLELQIITDDNTAFSSATIAWRSGVLALATLTAGYEFLIRFIPKITEKYYRANLVVATADFTAGLITVGAVEGRQSNR